MQPKRPSGVAYWRRVGLVIACPLILISALGYAVGVPLLLIGFSCGAFLVVFGASLLARHNEITTAAKERSALRPFIERVRHPDPEFPNFLSMLTHVVPWSIVFFSLGLFAIRIMAETFFGRQSWVTSAFEALALAALKGTIPAMIAAYAGLWSLRAYVAIRLRRDGRDHGASRIAEKPNNGIQADGHSDAPG